MEFQKRLKDISPSPIQTNINQGVPIGLATTDEKNNKTLEEMTVRTRGFRLGMGSSAKKKDVSESYCFDSLHELCNIQIDELKKSYKHISHERDQLMNQLEESRDSY
jgi:hypothetical protein